MNNVFFDGENEKAIMVNRNGVSAPVAKSKLSAEDADKLRALPPVPSASPTPSPAPSPPQSGYAEAPDGMTGVIPDQFVSSPQAPMPMVPQQVPQRPLDPSIVAALSPQAPAIPQLPDATQEVVPPAPKAPDYFGQMKNAALGQAKAEQEGANLANIAAQNYEDQVLAVSQEYANKRAELEKKQKQDEDDFRNARLDPNRFWNQKTGFKGGASRVLSFLGVMLGGMQASKGGGNPALMMIDKAINDDIESQKVDINKKQSLLKENLEKYGSLAAAEQATKLDMLNVFKAQLEGFALKTKSEMAKKNADFQLAQIGLQQQQLQESIAKEAASRKLMQVLGSNVVPDSLVAVLPKEQGELMVSLRPNENVRARSAKDAADIRESKPKIDNVISLIDQTLMDMGRDPKTGKPDPRLKDKIGTAVGGDLPLIGSLPGSGEEGRERQSQIVNAVLAAGKSPMRLNEFTDEKYIKTRVPNPAQYRTDDAVNDLMRLRGDFIRQSDQEFANRTYHNPNQITPTPGRAK